MNSPKKLFCCALIVVCLCGLSAVAEAQQFRQWITVNARSPRVGTQVKIERITPAMGKQIKAAGFDFVRFGVWVNAMQDASYQARVANAFAAAQEAGLPVLLTVRSTVPLVLPELSQLDRDEQLREAAKQLARVVVTLGNTYGHNVLAIELWNEPELPTYWPTGDLDSTFPIYMQAVCSQLKSVHALIPIIGFGFATAPALGSKSDRLLRSLSSSPAQCMNAVSYHAYGMSEQQIQDASAYIRSQYGLPALITEWGISSGGRAGIFGQATGIKSFLMGRGSLKTPLISIYEWQDTENAKNAREQNFGLVDATGVKKPALDATLDVIRKR
ncbi:cellulase family glycosylhydrolase [Paraburkholderia nemoris]|uniref:cellulase family glycosylhydrolase n=1 Tax=Paraburkholderia nemoris TaxID=2793076 RepID=UPI0038B802F1